jgi:hypothetical protein
MTAMEKEFDHEAGHWFFQDHFDTRSGEAYHIGENDHEHAKEDVIFP